MIRKLTSQEVTAAFDGSEYPPIMTPLQAAGLLGLKLSTLYRHVSEGRYRESVRRGKPLRFFRDRLVQEFFRCG